MPKSRQITALTTVRITAGDSTDSKTSLQESSKWPPQSLSEQLNRQHVQLNHRGSSKGPPRLAHIPRRCLLLLEKSNRLTDIELNFEPSLEKSNRFRSKVHFPSYRSQSIGNIQSSYRIYYSFSILLDISNQRTHHEHIPQISLNYPMWPT